MAEKINLIASFYDEEHMIEGYFRNVGGVVDRKIIALVENPARERIRKMCESHGATIIMSSKKFFENNVLDLLAKVPEGEWILLLDLDERLSEGLKKEVREAAERSTADACFIRRFNFAFTGFITHDPKNAYTPRLFRKGALRWEKIVPHETSALYGRTERLKNPIYHYQNTSVSLWMRHATEYIESLARSFERKGRENLLWADRVGFGKHGWSRLLFYPLFQILNYLFRHRLILEGKKGFILSVCWGIYVFLEEADYCETAAKKKGGMAFDWKKEYPIDLRP